MVCHVTRAWWNRLAAWALAVMLMCATGCDREPAPASAGLPSDGPTPNVILILVDTLRADRLGAYGYERNLTLTMDAIADEGMLFERAIAPSPWTQPSMASLFSGVYPGVHGVTDYQLACDATNKVVPKVKVFRESFETLAEVLQKRGYATAGFVANPYLLADYGFAQGFETYDASFAALDTTGDVINDAALAWLEKRDAGKPFFLYLHYMDVHGPYNAPRDVWEPLVVAVEQGTAKLPLEEAALVRLQYLRKPPPDETDLDRYRRLARYREYWVARYDAGVAVMDRYLADLRRELDQRGLWDNSWVILTSDHGEALFEHGHWDHGLSTHHPELHVPLILRWPGVLRAGQRIPATVRLIDLLPTLVEQLRLPAERAFVGHSLVSFPDDAAFFPAYAEAVKKGPPQHAVYVGPWKLLVCESDATPQLFNVEKDPLEQRDRFSDHPDFVPVLLTLLRQHREWSEGVAAVQSVEEVPLTPAQLERLKSLGYVQ
jgi:arylsulfatase